MFSIIIPAKNESKNIENTINSIAEHFNNKDFSYEILIIDDWSTDDTAQKVTALEKNDHAHIPVRLIKNTHSKGIGNAIKKGLEEFSGDFVIITMADLSDDPQDMAAYAEIMNEGTYDCCFGDRWSNPNLISDYPKHKLLLNRLANWFIRTLFHLHYKDITNAFKCYSRTTIDGIKPILSHHFNITVELPLKAITRGYSYAVIPTKWRGRKTGVSRLKIQEMGSRYLFIVLYIFLEKTLCKKDYQKR